MKKDDTSNLTQLGSKTTEYTYSDPNWEILESFPNKNPDNDYDVEFNFPEFTSLCPKTGQPDFATIRIVYNPDELCVETKSLKLYFFSYRNCGSFMESITNKILNDLVKAIEPKRMEVEGIFNPRGGVALTILAKYRKPASFQQGFGLGK